MTKVVSSASCNLPPAKLAEVVGNQTESEYHLRDNAYDRLFFSDPPWSSGFFYVVSLDFQAQVSTLSCFPLVSPFH
jgi:hypothetical protein